VGDIIETRTITLSAMPPKAKLADHVVKGFVPVAFGQRRRGREAQEDADRETAPERSRS
jgi:hypothetical protein